ncbi:MAG: TIGR02300 family protein [Deltaproteobacteria bacterium]
MPRDLGAKHACFNCGTKFYDLHKPEPLCPKCGADPREASAKPRSTAAEKKRARAAAAEEETAESEELETPADEDDETEEGDVEESAEDDA